MVAELWKSNLRNMYTKQQNQKRPAISLKKKNVLFLKCIILCNNLLDQSKKQLIKYFL